MASQTLTQMHQSISSPALPGTWKLGAGRAITLQPTEPGTLRVAHGVVWATYDGPHGGALNDLGDHVLGVGEHLHVRAGQRLVVEAWRGGNPAYFSWDPAPVRAVAPVRQRASVMQPLADLRMAWVLGIGAAARLVAGLALWGWEMVAGRDRLRPADGSVGPQSIAARRFFPHAMTQACPPA